MRTRTILTSTLALCLTLGLAGPAQAAPDRVRGLIDLGTLGGKNTYVTAVNERGQVVGASETGDGRIHAFLWQRGVMTDLGTLGGLNSWASAINDRGQVTGSSSVGLGEEGRAFVWERGVMKDLGGRGGGVDINNRGQIIGTQGTDASETSSYLWSKGKIRDLGNLGFPVNEATDINDRGEVIGMSDPVGISSHGYIWRNGHLRDLNPLPAEDWIETRPTGINNRGQVVGTRFNRFGISRAFLWKDWAWTDIGFATGSTIAVALNKHGSVAGISQTAGYSDVRSARAFLFRNGRTVLLRQLPGATGYNNVVDVNNHNEVIGGTTVTEPDQYEGKHTGILWQHGRPIALPGLGYQGPETPGDSRTGVVDINDRGQIVGQSRTPSGDVHAVLIQAPRH